MIKKFDKELFALIALCLLIITVLVSSMILAYSDFKSKNIIKFYNNGDCENAYNPED